MDEISGHDAGSIPATDQARWFGHPRGLSTLFFTEMWERFSYYGMRALLVLFMTAPAAGANPGFGYSDGHATAIYGLYTFFVYVLSLPGGWVADSLWGAKKTVFVGGCIIAAGHFTMAGPLLGLPEEPTFFAGLLLVVLGTGLLKPNVSSIVGDLYPEGGARRDAGFSVFYMGINLGAILGPLLCGLVGEGYNWHWGFSLAGFGMLLGLISYRYGERFLVGAGDLSSTDDARVLSVRARRLGLTVVGFGVALSTFGYLLVSGLLGISLEQLAGGLGALTVVITLGFFSYIIVWGGHSRDERKRLVVIAWLFILSAIFWSGFEQAGSSLSLFARDLTDRVWFGVEVPASTLQLVNPLFIVILAPVFGWLWVWLARKNANPSIPAKFGIGLLGLASGFLLLSIASAGATPDDPEPVHWLLLTFFLHTVGELCLSPVGLSSMTKLAPRNRVSQMMGIWFVSAALGNLFAGLLAGRIEDLPPSDLFETVAWIVGGSGVVALVMAPLVRRLIGKDT